MTVIDYFSMLDWAPNLKFLPPAPAHASVWRPLPTSTTHPARHCLNPTTAGSFPEPARRSPRALGKRVSLSLLWTPGAGCRSLLGHSSLQCHYAHSWFPYRPTALCKHRLPLPNLRFPREPTGLFTYGHSGFAVEQIKILSPLIKSRMD